MTASSPPSPPAASCATSPRTDALSLSSRAVHRTRRKRCHAGDPRRRPPGLGFYIDHRRVHVGSDTPPPTWPTPRGRRPRRRQDTILLAPTNDTSTRSTSAPARPARRARPADPKRRSGNPTVVCRQMAATPGDTIRTRRNAAGCPVGRTDFVRNGYPYQIIDTDGRRSMPSATCAPNAHHPTRRLYRRPRHAWLCGHHRLRPRTYRPAHLPYRRAEHLTRQLLYVALTRGTEENHIYLSTAEADPHRVLSPKATHPQTAVDVSATLPRDGAQSRPPPQPAKPPTPRPASPPQPTCTTTRWAQPPRTASPRAPTRQLAPADQLSPRSARPSWPVLRKHSPPRLRGPRPAAACRAAAKDDLYGAPDPAAVLD